MALLELRGISKRFGQREVLSNVHLRLEEGEFVAIVGYSGSGKTTLVSLLAGLMTCDEGEACFEGQPITAPGPERGVVFQNYSLLPWLTVFENVLLAVDSLHPEWSPEQRHACAETYVQMVNLSHARDRRPAALSGGMRQRVSVARALAMKPRVLLLDEPLSALDALSRATLQDEIARIRAEQNQTVLLITNDPDEAILLADRVIPLTRGPGATLGPSIPITLPRPRDRRTLNECPDFKRLRNQVIDALLSGSPRTKSVLTRELILPDIEPEDLTRARSRGPRPVPLRKHERQAIEVEVPTED